MRTFTTIDRKHTYLLGTILLILAWTVSVAESAVTSDLGRNIAQGAKYVVSPQPNYVHCTDPDDAIQLTDGEITKGYFGTKKSTVGWRATRYVTITLDLGKITPIGGVSFRTAAGTAGVTWPSMIGIFVSDEGKAYRDVGDLMVLDEAGPLPETGYAVHRFVTSKLKTCGRYLRFLVITDGPYIFADEIEVFRGPDSLLESKPVEERIWDAEQMAQQYRIKAAMHRRFDNDVARLSRLIRTSKVSEDVRGTMLKRLRGIEGRLNKIAPVSDISSFRAVLPLNTAHAELFELQAELWKVLSYPALSAWVVPPWDPLDLFDLPSTKPGRIEVHTMLGEYRSAAFNLANATGKPIRASIRFDNLAGSPKPPYITVHEVPWTDTVTGQAVAAALPHAEQKTDRWLVNVQPGLVQQVWLTFHVSDLPAGEHRGEIVIASEAVDPVRIPIRLQVYPITFPKQTTLWLGGWSYTNGKGARGVSADNRRLLIEHLRNRFVNAPWATGSAMRKFTFKDGKSPTVVLNTEEFDEWIERWPEAKTYMVFLAVNQTFANAQMWTEAFNRKVGVWISAWVDHLQSKGIKPEQLALLLVDEPHKADQDKVIIAWAKAIHAAEPDVLIWEDPTYSKPTEAKQELFDVCDVLCLNRPMWLKQGRAFGDFYLDQRKKGRVLQLYSCSGPARLLDPYAYYRLQAWHCWKIGANGSFFWAFGDTGGGTSWNEYTALRGPWTPQFLDERSVTPGKQMEAIRESVQDYEYFVMLKKLVDQALANGDKSQTVNEAQRLLKTAPDTVLNAKGTNDLQWHTPKDRTIADTVRVQLLQAISRLSLYANN